MARSDLERCGASPEDCERRNARSGTRRFRSAPVEILDRMIVEKRIDLREMGRDGVERPKLPSAMTDGLSRRPATTRSQKMQSRAEPRTGDVGMLRLMA